MKKKILTEFIWLAGCLIASQIFSAFFINRSTLDINVHDTYTIGSSMNSKYYYFFLPVLYFITYSFCVYLIRVSYFGFKIVHIAIIFLIFNALVLFYLANILFFLLPPNFEIMHTNSESTRGLFYGNSGFYSRIW